MKFGNKKNNELNKKILIAITIIALILILSAILLILSSKKSNEKKLESKLSKMGASFYENFYYERINSSETEKNLLLSTFEKTGIKIDLQNLEQYNNGEFKDEIQNFTNSLTNEKCNKTKTKVTIYPKSPYGKTDYKIETELSCGFDNKN
mgnify:CR=1 FL=1